MAAGFFTGGILAIRGGLSVAFKNAFIGGVILLLIEGVSTIVTSVAMRHQYMAQQAEMEKLKNMTEKQRMEYMQNMWNTEYNQQESNANKEGETMLDKAKSFSY